jgi:hypothetical protein
MTSGQGGNPYGPPEGWNAPYAPAPSAPSGYGAPQSMERPVTVRAGLGAFIAVLILGLISSIVTFSNFGPMLDAALAAQGADTADLGVDPESFARMVLIVGVVIGLVMSALQLLFIWFAWKGRNWARIVLWVFGGLGLVGGLVGVAAPQPGEPGFVVGLSLFSFLLTAAGIALLALKPSNEWYRFRKWQRATGQG